MNYRIKKNELIVILIVYLFVFQDPLANKINIFSLIDEIYALLFFGLLTSQRTLNIKKENFIIFILLIVFGGTGVYSNVIYRYQPFNLVLIDLFTNLKFFLSIGTTILLFRGKKSLYNLENKKIVFHLKLITSFLFFVFLLDRVLNIYDGDFRFGLKSATLFYGHPTYLAAAVIFLISFLVLTYKKGNNVFILMNLIVLFFTFRSKAIAAVILCAILFIFRFYFNKKIKLKHIILVSLLCVLIARKQIIYYFFKTTNSARQILLQTSFVIMRDYFPIGTGFGTFGSNIAGSHYSPVYEYYGFRRIYELSGGQHSFFNDSFWPIIIGQTGCIGLLAYLIILLIIIKKIWKLQKLDKRWFLGGLLAFGYLIISSSSEPAFNNSIAIPLAMVIGIAINLGEQIS